jgi:hypothetical protein
VSELKQNRDGSQAPWTLATPTTGRIPWIALLPAAALLVLVAAGLAFTVYRMQPPSGPDESDRPEHVRGPAGDKTVKKADSTTHEKPPASAKPGPQSVEPSKPSSGKKPKEPETSIPNDPRPQPMATSPATTVAAKETPRPEPKPKPKPVGKPEENSPKEIPGLKEGDIFYQEVAIARLSSYRFLGTEIAQNVQYAFLSSFKIEKKNADGGMVVLQKVETARFGKGDAAMQALLNKNLQKTKGASFKIVVNAKREITAFEGAGDKIDVFEGKNAGNGQAFLLWSFMDRDGWKELAQVTLFVPEKPGTTREKWARPMTHSWGPLGSWGGRVIYGRVGKKDKMDRIAYALDMVYRPPAQGGGGGLPFKIVRAAFKPQTAGGTILFDPARNRVAAAEERFHVKGILAVAALGVTSVIEMDEAQIFQLRVLDKKPVAKE